MGIDLFYCGINAIILTKSRGRGTKKIFGFLFNIPDFLLKLILFLVEIFALIVGEIIKVKRDWSNESPTDSNLIKYYYNCTRFISNVKLQLHNGNAHGSYHHP